MYRPGLRVPGHDHTPHPWATSCSLARLYSIRPRVVRLPGATAGVAVTAAVERFRSSLHHRPPAHGHVRVDARGGARAVGRCAAAYRFAFGESPLQTLRREWTVRTGRGDPNRAGWTVRRALRL